MKFPSRLNETHLGPIETIFSSLVTPGKSQRNGLQQQNWKWYNLKENTHLLFSASFTMFTSHLIVLLPPNCPRCQMLRNIDLLFVLIRAAILFLPYLTSSLCNVLYLCSIINNNLEQLCNKYAMYVLFVHVLPFTLNARVVWIKSGEHFRARSKCLRIEKKLIRGAIQNIPALIKPKTWKENVQTV